MHGDTSSAHQVLTTDDNRLPLSMHGDTSSAHQVLTTDKCLPLSIYGDTSTTHQVSSTDKRLPLSMHGDASTTHQVSSTDKSLPLSIYGDTSTTHQVSSTDKRLPHGDTSAFLVDNETSSNKQVQCDYSDESDDDIQECEIFDQTDLVFSSSCEAGKVEEVLNVLFQHLSIVEIWENIDDIYQEIQDLTRDAVNTVTPAPHKSSTCNPSLNRQSGTDSNCVSTQLNFISPDNTSHHNGGDVLKKSIDKLSMDFKNHHSDKYNYGFYWNFEQDLAMAAAGNIEEFFDKQEYMLLLTLINSSQWDAPFTFFQSIFCSDNEYVLAYMDSRTFCLHVWASTDDGRIQSLYDNIRTLISAMDIGRNVSICKNIFQAETFSETDLLIILLAQLYSVREGKNIDDMSIFNKQVLSESKRKWFIDMVHTVQFPSIDDCFDVCFKT
jgi:hypothetical protein